MSKPVRRIEDGPSKAAEAGLLAQAYARCDDSILEEVFGSVGKGPLRTM
jgi:hypothetical protein